MNFNGFDVIQYWLGMPGRYSDDRKDLHLHSRGDNGGREVQLPAEISPQKFFDMTMPMVLQLQVEAQKRMSMDRNPLHPFGVLAQGIQVTWIFTSLQVQDMQKHIHTLEDQTRKLTARIEQLEGQPLDAA